MESSNPDVRSSLETFVTGGEHGLLIPDVTARTASERGRRRRRGESGVGAWCVRIHVRVFERYLWRERRHADGNECPGFSDVSPIIVHSRTCVSYTSIVLDLDRRNFLGNLRFDNILEQDLRILRRRVESKEKTFFFIDHQSSKIIYR